MTGILVFDVETLRVLWIDEAASGATGYPREALALPLQARPVLECIDTNGNPVDQRKAVNEFVDGEVRSVIRGFGLNHVVRWVSFDAIQTGLLGRRVIVAFVSPYGMDISTTAEPLLWESKESFVQRFLSSSDGYLKLLRAIVGRPDPDEAKTNPVNPLDHTRTRFPGKKDKT